MPLRAIYAEDSGIPAVTGNATEADAFGSAIKAANVSKESAGVGNAGVGSETIETCCPFKPVCGIIGAVAEGRGTAARGANTFKEQNPAAGE